MRFSLVGCGRISHRHAEVLSSGQVPGASLAAVCDVDTEKSSYLANKFNVPSYSSYHDMAKQEQPDVFVVLTESGYHARHVIDLSTYGKPIIVEKPMALRVSDCLAMIKACSESSSMLFVVKQNRFNIPIVQLRKAIESGRFGKHVLGTIRVRWCRPQNYYDMDDWRGTWSMDGGVLTNQASHHLDMLQWMMGDIDQVFAFGATQLSKIEVEDTAVVSVRFSSGALGVIEATTAVRPKDQEGSISIIGENGYAEIGGIAMNKIKSWIFEKPTAEDSNIQNLYSENPSNVYGFGHRAFYIHVMDCLEGRAVNALAGSEGIKTVRLIHAIYESMRLNQPIYLSDNPECGRLGAQIA